MRVIERTIEHPENEGVILEYVNWAKDFAEIKEYVKFDLVGWILWMICRFLACLLMLQ